MQSSASTASKKTFVQKYLRRSTGPKNERSPFFSKKTTEAPAPIKDGPQLREVTGEQAKAETRATETERAKAKTEAAETDLEQTETATKTIHGSSKDREPTTQTPQTDKSFVKENFAKKTEITVKGPFAAIWDYEKSATPHEVQYTFPSHYVPNYLSIAESHKEMERQLVGNIHIEWTEKKFLTLPVRLYLATMYYVRILMIREALRKNTTGQSTWLRKFLREYSPASLPLPGYLVPQFQAIAAYAVPTDSRQSWLYPEIPDNIWSHLVSDEDNDHQWKLTQPNPAILFDMMRLYCARGTDLDDDDHKQDGEFIIAPLDANFHLGGKLITGNANHAHDTIYLCNPTINSSFAESPLTFAERRRDWQNSNFSDHTAAPAAMPAGNQEIPDMLNLSQDMDWFNECVSMTRILCSFCKHSTNFGQLDYEAGPEVAIFGDVRIGSTRTERSRPLGAAYGNHDDNTAVTIATKSWYPDIINRAYADHLIYEKGVAEVCYLNAKHTLTNSRIVFYLRMSAVNADRVTRLICLGNGDENGYNAGGFAARSGPFYGVNTNRNRANRTVTHGAALEDGVLMTIWRRLYDQRVHVLTGREDLIRDRFYSNEKL